MINTKPTQQEKDYALSLLRIHGKQKEYDLDDMTARQVRELCKEYFVWESPNEEG